MKTLITMIISIVITISVFSQDRGSLTEMLTKQFNQAWNKENINEMISLLQPDAFFKSPYQLRYGREQMAATVLKTNPPAYKIVEIKEQHSKVKDDIAWSIGDFSCDLYDEQGNKTNEVLEGSYTYVFTKKSNKDWKLQMMIFHEK